MRHIRIPFLVVVLSLMLTGMAFAIDLPYLTTWTGSSVNYTNNRYASGQSPGTTVAGVGGGGVGFGDVLLAPLYDVRQLTDPSLPGVAGTTPRDQQTLILIVNTDDTYNMIARIRFREWKRSREVLDIDIPLTKNDVWVAEVRRNSGGGANIWSPDKYITNNAGAFPSTTAFQPVSFPAAGINFPTTDIEAAETNKLARTEYGYFEVIGEERVGTADSITGYYPRYAGTSVLTSRDVDNVLMGTVYIIRPDVAISHQYNMTALANFSVDIRGIEQLQGTGRPSLLQDVQGEGGNPGAGGFDNLEALLSKRWIDFQYAIGPDPADLTATPMNTSLVITFPTKYLHYQKLVAYYPIFVAYPYGKPFTGTSETLGDGTITYYPGEVYNVSIWDRSENLLRCPVSPCPTSRLYYEVNVLGLKAQDYAAMTIEFRNNQSIATANTVTAQTFYSGWGEVDLSPALASLGETRTVRQGEQGIVFNFFNNFMTAYRGLPAIGIVMTEFYNGAPTVNGYYGNTVPWQYGVDWACLTCDPQIPFVDGTFVF